MSSKMISYLPSLEDGTDPPSMNSFLPTAR